MSRVVLPFSHGVRDELTFNYTKSVIGGEETLLFTGKYLFYILHYALGGVLAMLLSQCMYNQICDVIKL